MTWNSSLILILVVFICRNGFADDTHEVDWHEWVTADEGDEGSPDLSWTSYLSWQALANSTLGAPRPPIFLIPGIASTRLVNWREKRCRRGSKIKAREVVWVSVGKLLEASTGAWTMGDPTCWSVVLFVCSFAMARLATNVNERSTMSILKIPLFFHMMIRACNLKKFLNTPISLFCAGWTA